MKHLLILLASLASLLFLCPFQMQAQTQTLKGQVVDKAVRAELIGATVQIAPSDAIQAPLKGAVTDANGRFRITSLPVGKYTVLVTYLGYRDAVLSNITVDAGKETDLLVELEESVLAQKEVVIKATVDKEKPLNDFSLVSARTFSVEETRRFAAAVNDPARMATSYAGVVTGGDGSNVIVVRGNAPNGMLWRMEGVDIPNPNHFSSVGTSGGGISILSSQLLTNSDFSTGAFAAEYGNALSGVFDLKLRKGNIDRREFTVQAGVLGLDLAAEGPIASGRSGQTGSYLINYRYSTLSILSKLGVQLGDATTDFQDLSFNIWKPAGKIGSFSLFGLGGLSNQALKGVPDTASWSEQLDRKYPFDFLANTGVLGATHSKTWGNNTFLKTVLVVSGTNNGFELNRYLLPDYNLRRDFETKAVQTKTTISSVLSHKFNARHYLRTGVYVNWLEYNFKQLRFEEEDNALVEQLNQKGTTQTFNGFAQWQYRPTDRLTFNMGVHTLALVLHNKVSVEPRAALRYAANAQHAFSVGYGLHSQVLPLGVYFVKNDAGKPLNPDLGLNKAQHFVLSHDYMLRKNLHLKTELYYQHLFDVPVEKGVSNSFSILNERDGIVYRQLEQTGTGRNYGLEFTGEQFLTRGLYWLMSASLFRSEYRGSDKIWRNTRYDTRYAATFTGGKEWNWNKRGKNRTFGVNVKLIASGGQKATPIDLQASKEKGEAVYVEQEAFRVALPGYFRLDTGVRLKRNYRHLTTTLSLDLQNTTNRQNVGERYFEAESGTIKTWYQSPLIPVLAYRLEF
jgi:hypothetical protein